MRPLSGSAWRRIMKKVAQMVLVFTLTWAAFVIALWAVITF
jgi:hypothetical protein